MNSDGDTNPMEESYRPSEQSTARLRIITIILSFMTFLELSPYPWVISFYHLTINRVFNRKSSPRNLIPPLNPKDSAKIVRN